MSTEVGKEYDEMEGMEKLERQVTALTKIFQTLGDKVKNQQIGQLAKIHQSREKMLKVDKQHHDLRVKQIAVQKLATIQAFAERQQEIRLTKQLTASMKNQKNVYDGVLKSISGGTGLRQGLNMMTGRLNEMRKATQAVTEATKKFEKEMKNPDSTKVDGLYQDMRNKQKILREWTMNNNQLKTIAGRLANLADFMEKHQGKFLIGAGVASVLIGIISKALNVAPMFQAMFKLMQLAVNMILMPIGTFIGAMVKPFMLMVITTLAPMFKDMMMYAMTAGDAVGKFFTGEMTLQKMAEILMNIPTFDPKNPYNPNSNGGGSDHSPTVIDDVARFAIPAAAIGGFVYTAKKIIPRIGTGIGNFFNTNNANSKVKPVPATSPNPTSNLTPKAGVSKFWTNAFTKAVSGASKAFLPLMLVDILANISPAGDNPKTERERLMQEGNGLDAIGMVMSDIWSSITGKPNGLDDVNSQWIENEEEMQKINDHFKGVEESFNIVGTDAERVGEVFDTIGNEIAPMAAQNMVAFENDVIRMASYGYSSAQIMMSLAETYRLTDAQVKSQLGQISTGTGGIAQNPNSDAARAARRALAGYRDDAGGIDARQEADATKRK